MKTKTLDYFDFKKVNALLEGFSQATGFVTAILDLDGNIMCKAGWREICTDFHRKNPDSAVNCIVSDTKLAKESQDIKKYHYYKCVNGLIDVQAPIIVKGEHIANLYSGQFLFEKPDVNFFKKQAEKFAFNESAYLEALGKVPIVSKEEVELAMGFLLEITQMITDMTAERIKLEAQNEVIKNSKKSLLESETLLEQNVNDLLKSQEIARLGTWRLSLATKQIVASPELYKIYGIDSTIHFSSYLDHKRFFTLESWNILSAAIEHTSKSGSHYEVELETIKVDGANGWVWARGEADRDSDGNIISIWGAIQDITERKQIEMQLRESEERFQLLFEKAPMGYQSLDIDGNIIAVNQKWLDIFGYQKNEVIGKWFGDFLAPGYQEGFRKRFLLFKEQGYIHSEFEMIGKSRGKMFIAFEGSLGYTNSGDFKQTHCILKDITEENIRKNQLLYMSYHDQLTGVYNRRYYEEELTRLENTRKLPVAIVMCDVNGLKLVNDSFGHTAGDQLLIKTAEIIRNCCRTDDLVARYGGDEFAIILPNTSSQQVELVIERIKVALEKESVCSVNISVSFGYETKTTSGEKLKSVLKSAEDHMYQEKLYESGSVRRKTVDIIINTLYEKNHREMYHSKRVSKLCGQLAMAINMSTYEVNQICIAGLMHDIGKIGVDETILNKVEKLTNSDWNQLKKHSEIGYRILSSVNEFSEIANFVLEHQEKWDGSGYPKGLQGEKISKEARIIAIADAYDAMTGMRAYREKMTKEDAIAELTKCAGSQFDVELTKTFIEKVLGDQET